MRHRTVGLVALALVAAACSAGRATVGSTATLTIGITGTGCRPPHCPTTTLPPLSGCRRSLVTRSFAIDTSGSSSPPICLHVGARYRLDVSWQDSGGDYGGSWGGPMNERPSVLAELLGGETGNQGFRETFQGVSPGVTTVAAVRSPARLKSVPPCEIRDYDWTQSVKVVR
jgi:hypothetical protein